MNNAVPALTPEEFARNFAEIHPPFTRQGSKTGADECHGARHRSACMNNAVPALTPEEFARNFAEIHPPFTRQGSQTDVDEFARLLDLSLAECMAQATGARV